MKTSRPCELAIPAGSLQCALYAFKGGADAVYFGLKSFSARKGAVNFSFEDVRKIKAYCQANGRKFYVTLNTIVSDSELKEVIPLLRQLEYLQPDGVIVQDLGIARIMRKHFPSLPLHGSTQLAVHTINGVKQLQELGFSRVVLSRELSFEEIKAIREACPDVELKVFIHGALCYGFSGLCMASQFITGDGHYSDSSCRSANRGSCAQICRTWFHCDETGTDSWLFSMKDLCLGEKVRQYAEIGIDSLKVEGRMKGPDYAYWSACYYRLLLDGRNENEQEVRWAREAMQISFSRDTTEYFFNTGKAGSLNAPNMVCASDPGHKGVQVGTIDKVLPNGKAVIRFIRPVALRDGLKVMGVGFSLRHIEGGKSFISENEVATVNFPAEEFEKRPGFGTPVYCVSRHNLNLGLLNENIPLYKKPVDVDVKITENTLEIEGRSYGIDVQLAKSQSDMNQILTKIFEASDKSYFTLGKLSADNCSGFTDPFIPAASCKEKGILFLTGKSKVNGVRKSDPAEEAAKKSGEYTVTVNGKAYGVKLGKTSATVNGVEYPLSVAAGIDQAAIAAAQAPAAAGSASPAPTGGQAVAAPMPGLILRIDAKEGQKVTKNQLVMVMEAMKMENEIYAPCDGTITKISVSQGDQVVAGDTLLTIA